MIPEKRGVSTKVIHQDRCDVVLALPVLRQLAARIREDVGRQIWNLDPGHNEVAGIIDHEGEVPFPDVRRPSDEGIAGCGLPCGGREAEHGQGAALPVLDRIAHLCTDKGLVAEIMIAGDEFIPEAAGRTAGTGDP